LARLAGLTASSAIVEIMNADGTMSRRPDLEIFAEKHDIKIGTIADLIHYRMANEKTIDAVASETINTEFGEFRMHKFVDTIQGETHIALTKGDIKADVPCIVRVQTGDFLRDILNAVKPGTQSWSSQAALKKISDEGTGALVLLSAGIAENVASSLDFYLGKSKPAKSPNVDSSGAFLTIGTGSQILREIGVQKMRLLSSPVKYPAISGFDLEVIEYIPYEA
jgi:3,4-dihydroxy 2-butanone 4-phosphate synthase/GTP cyclohydrolase II